MHVSLSLIGPRILLVAHETYACIYMTQTDSTVIALKKAKAETRMLLINRFIVLQFVSNRSE